MPTIRENLTLLRSLIEVEPDHLIDVSMFVDEDDCGTKHCGLGLAACHPHFQQQGLQLHANAERGPWRCTLNDEHPESRALDKLFGENAWDNVFTDCCGDRDDEVYESFEQDVEHDEDILDKHILLKRIDLQLESLP